MGDILAAIQRDLSRRFATDYRIVAADDPDAISVRDSVTGQEHSQTAAGLFVLIGADLVNWSLDRPPCRKKPALRASLPPTTYATVR
jgi:hypothetical protein